LRLVIMKRHRVPARAHPRRDAHGVSRGGDARGDDERDERFGVDYCERK
jgi:hypothetical protein